LEGASSFRSTSRHFAAPTPAYYACWACAKIAYDLSTVMHIHEEINAYRDMIDAGKPRTAIALLTALRDRLPANRLRQDPFSHPRQHRNVSPSAGRNANLLTWATRLSPNVAFAARLEFGNRTIVIIRQKMRPDDA
jgi:hypothetical protein